MLFMVDLFVIAKSRSNSHNYQEGTGCKKKEDLYCSGVIAIICSFSGKKATLCYFKKGVI